MFLECSQNLVLLHSRLLDKLHVLSPALAEDIVTTGSAGTFVDGHLTVFSGSTGMLIKDGGTPSNFLVVQVFS